MKKTSAFSGKTLHTVFSFFLGILIGIIVCVITDAAFTAAGHTLRIRFFAAGLVSVSAVLALIGIKFPLMMKKLSLFFFAVLIFIAAASFVIWLFFIQSADYRCPDSSDKAGLFSARNVMLIVPHEDDDLNLLGGAIEEYVSYGSTLRVVFTTNGDAAGLGKERIIEAINVLTDLGVPEDNIIFLGYGDAMVTAQGYYYNDADADAPCWSRDGHNAAYGIPGHSAYNDGNLYSRRHLTEDLKCCILEYRPDTLICVDLDSHLDHQSASMIFEEVMGEILQEYTDYTPLVLKGFAYSTAYLAAPDFYSSMNILSTVNPHGKEYMTENCIYRWDERIRFPVSSQSLSRSLFRCRLYKSAVGYETQGLQFISPRIINGDRVFWLRETDSLTYTAEITASSGDASLLNDFRLSYDRVLRDASQHTDGVWTYSSSDDAPCVTVKLKQASDISLIKLYDSPSLDDNVLALTVVFDNGNTYEVGPLAANGSAADIAVDEKNVLSFSVYINDTEGASAGLTEIEAYKASPDHGLEYIKITDPEENFIYDYITRSNGSADFELYSPETDISPDNSNYTVTCSNEKCSAEIVDGRIHVVCPRGETAVISVYDDNTALSDSIYVRNPYVFMRIAIKVDALFCSGNYLSATAKIVKLLRGLMA